MSVPLGELARIVGGTVEGDPERPIDGVAPLATAGAGELAFVDPPTTAAAVAASAAGALLTGPKAPPGAGDRDLLQVDNVRHALALLLERFHPPARHEPGVDPRAAVDGEAEVDPSAWIGAFAVVGRGSSIGARAAIHPHAVVGERCRVGADSILYPGAVLYDETIVGARCILHAGVVLGSDGFGYATRDGEHRKIPQVGRAVLEDDVEIGANSAVDRATMDETRIGAGVKLDNLVQVGHNVSIGRGSRLVAQVGIAGSTVLGDHVDLAGQVGVSGHLELGDGTQVAGKSAVFDDAPAGSRLGGIPAIDLRAWRRQQAVARRLGEIWRRLRAVERRLGAAEGGDDEP